MSALLVAGLAAGCTGGSSAPVSNGVGPIQPVGTAPLIPQVKHVVFIIQENRTFDSIFGGPNPFPNVDAATTGKAASANKPLTSKAMGNTADINNDYRTWLAACDPDPTIALKVGAPYPCRMDGFNLNAISTDDPYTYADRSQVAPYWEIARKYSIYDHFFSSQDGESYTGHQYLFAGQSGGTVDAPTFGGINALQTWNCGATSSATFLWQPNVTTLGAQPSATSIGPPTCWSYTNFADLLNRQNLSWRVYLPFVSYNINALGSFHSIYDSQKYYPSCGSVYCDNNDYFRASLVNEFHNEYPSDPKFGKLASVTWILPPICASDHPFPRAAILACGSYWSKGPGWVSGVINAIGQTADWNSTVIFVVWDDWGGFYDHVPPYVVRDAGGVGFRVPLMIVSPFTIPGCVGRTNAEFGAMLSFTELALGLGHLDAGSVDRSPASGDISECLDVTHVRPFERITTTSAAYNLAPTEAQPMIQIDDGGQ